MRIHFDTLFFVFLSKSLRTDRKQCINERGNGKISDFDVRCAAYFVIFPNGRQYQDRIRLHAQRLPQYEQGG